MLEEYKSMIKELEEELFKEKNENTKKINDFEVEIDKLKDEIEFERNYRNEMQCKLEQCMSLYDTIKRREETFIKNLGKTHIKKRFEVIHCEDIQFVPEKMNLDDRSLSPLYSDQSMIKNKLEKRISEILIRLNLDGIMKKTRSLNYTIGAKTVTLCLKQGEVCCKNGVALESYIFKNCKSEIEDFLRGRACPILNKKPMNRSPLVTSRTPLLCTQRIYRN